MCWSVLQGIVLAPKQRSLVFTALFSFVLTSQVSCDQMELEGYFRGASSIEKSPQAAQF